MSGELHDNPDRITGADSHEFDDVSNCLSISLPEFSMPGELHDNPDKITGVGTHEYIDVYLSVSLSINLFTGVLHVWRAP